MQKQIHKIVLGFILSSVFAAVASFTTAGAVPVAGSFEWTQSGTVTGQIDADGTILNVTFGGTPPTLHASIENDLLEADRPCGDIPATLELTGAGSGNIGVGHLCSHHIIGPGNTRAGITIGNTNLAPEFDGWTNVAPPADPVDDEEVDEASTTCVIDGMGWLICGIASTLARAMDGIYWLFESMLVVPNLNVDINSNNGMYNAWSIVRNIANLAFVASFLVIIFSQITNIGVSNYGIKKMLPRLIISAILVNVSYWVAAIAVDASNILGNSIYDMLQTIRTDELGGIAIGNQWETLILGLLSGAAVGFTAGVGITVLAVSGAAATASAALWLALPVMLSAGLAILVAIAVVGIRHALVVILIIISPLAFVAFLLPNTEKFFSMWRKTLTAMLVFYPIVSLIFAGSQLAAMLILQSLGDVEGPVAHMIVLALFVQVAPLILIPKIVSMGSGLIGRVTGMMNNKNRGLIDRSRKVRGRKVGLRAQEFRNSPSRRFKRGPLKGRRTTGGVIQSLARRNDYGRRRDESDAKTNENTAQAQWYQTAGGRESLRRATESELVAGAAKDAADAANLQDIPIELRLRAKSAKLDKDSVESQTEQAYQEFLAGDRSNRLLDSVDQGRLSELQTQAQDAQRAMHIAESATSMAKGEQQKQWVQELRDNADLANLAGGINPTGSIKVQAGAQSALSKERIDTIKNIESLIPYEDAIRLKDEGVGSMKWRFKNASSMDERLAISNMLGRAGNPGHEALKELLVDYDQDPGVSSEAKLEFKEILGENGDIRASSKAIDNWINGVRDSSGQHRGLQDIYNDKDTWKNLAPEKFTSMRNDAQKTAIQYMDVDALRRIRDHQSFGRVDDGVREILESKIAGQNP